MKKIVSSLIFVAMMLIANVSINAQSNLIRNTEEKDGVIVTETVYKLEGNGLTNYMKHHYKYDENKQRIEDEALKWNGTRDEWEKDLCIRYIHTEKTTTTEYYKWNKKKKDYVLVPEMTITMDK